MTSNTSTAIQKTMIRCKDHTTILVPSRTPFEFTKEFDGWTTLNTVQLIKRHEEIHYAFCRAIDKIQTKFFTIVDDDDPFPEMPEYLQDVGLTFGDNFIQEFGSLRRFPFQGPWTFYNHARNCTLTHRAICRTEDAQRILQDVKDEPIYTEQWLYSHLARDHGWNYDPSFVSIWDKKHSGLHLQIREVRDYTRQMYVKRYGMKF